MELVSQESAFAVGRARRPIVVLVTHTFVVQLMRLESVCQALCVLYLLYEDDTNCQMQKEKEEEKDMSGT